MRNIQSDAILLKLSPFGEIHGIGNFLTTECGLVHAFTHGIRSKTSKLRASCQLFNRGQIWLYFDPVKNTYKVQDFAISTEYSGIKSDYLKILTASLWCELASQEQGARVLEYLKLINYMDLLEHLPRAEVKSLALCFLFNFLTGNGLGIEQDIQKLLNAEFSPSDRIGFDVENPHLRLAKEGASPQSILLLRKIFEKSFDFSSFSISDEDGLYFFKQILAIAKFHLGVQLKSSESFKSQFI